MHNPTNNQPKPTPQPTPQPTPTPTPTSTPTSTSTPTPTPQPTPKPVTRHARALFDFPPESEHELELKVGDQVEVLREEGEWWFGSLPDGRQGYFPYNYVEKIGNW